MAQVNISNDDFPIPVLLRGYRSSLISKSIFSEAKALLLCKQNESTLHFKVPHIFATYVNEPKKGIHIVDWIDDLKSPENFQLTQAEVNHQLKNIGLEFAWDFKVEQFRETPNGLYLLDLETVETINKFTFRHLF